MALAKILARGQITIPREIREQVHLAPGDLVRIEPTGAGRFVVEVVPTLTLDEILRRFHSDEPVDMVKLRAAGEAEAADEVLSRIGEGNFDRG